MSPRRPAIPATCAKLDLALVERALVEAQGNVSAAASALSVPTSDLRRLIWGMPALAGAAYEAIERALDEAQATLFEQLRHDDVRVRLKAAIFLVRHSEAARRRGWGRVRASAAFAAPN
jgi:hypothetical protein